MLLSRSYSSLSSSLSHFSSPLSSCSFYAARSPSFSLFLKSTTRVQVRHNSTETNKDATTETPATTSAATAARIEEIKRTRDQLLHTFTSNLRVSIVNNSKSARRAQELHKLPPVEAQLLGKTMAGVILLSSFLEGEERIIAEMRGQGPVSVVSAEAIHVGEVRGHILTDSGPLSTISGALRDGYFRLTKILYGHTQPVTSSVELQKGDIESEFEHYLEKSDQVPSAVLLESVVDDKGTIEFCGGIIVQTLPQAPADIIDKAKEIFSKSSFVEGFILKKKTLHEMMHSLTPEKITEEIVRTQVDFFCRCAAGSFKAKMSALGHEELHNMQKSNQREVKCVNCAKIYSMSDKDFGDMHEMLDVRAREKEAREKEEKIV